MPKVIKRGPGDGPIMPQQTMRPSGPAGLSSAPKLATKAAPIIQKELVDANVEARRIRQDAELEAQQIREAAEAAASETREQGYQEGYQEGLAAYTEQTTRAILQLRKKEEALEGELIKLVRVCVEKVLSQEIKSHPEQVIGIVRGALLDARQQREIIVRVNPEDADTLKKNQRRLLEVLARANSVEIREDNSVSRGGCIVVTELGMIDASLQRQMDAIERAIEEEIREGAPAGASAPDEPEDYGGEEGEPEEDGGYGSY